MNNLYFKAKPQVTPFTGGTIANLTVTGNTIVGGLTATTISATTYNNLPTDVRVTGGTYDNNTGTATFTNNTGGTFNVLGFYTGETDDNQFVTGFTYNNNTFTILDNSGNTFNATINTMTGLTINGNLDVTSIDDVDYIDFNTSAAQAGDIGRLIWNNQDGTLNLGLKGGNVTLQVGQEQVIRVVNKTATNVNLLEANYQAVRVTGAQGQRLKVDLAQATNGALSMETIGLVTETINNNQEGFITTSGLVRGINTTGSLQSETWADGDVVYLSPTTAGNITNVKPIAPDYLIVIGYVVSAHITQGSIFVKVDHSYELGELHDVLITSPVNGNVIQYNSTTSLWENTVISTTDIYVTGGTYNFTGDTLTLNRNDNVSIPITGFTYERNSDYVYPYFYGGTAPLYTLNSTPNWIIKRVDYTTSGSPITLTAIGSWDDRYILIYS